MREILFILIACFNLSPITGAQEVVPLPPLPPPASIDFENVIVPITAVKPGVKIKTKLSGLAAQIGAKLSFATGFCLDPECSLIVTNYHVAAIARPKKIEGAKVVWRYLDTGSKRDGATLNMVDGQLMAYSVNHDLAIIVLSKPLRHHHGLAFSIDELEIGQPVDIYAYPLEGINVFRKPMRFYGTFQGPTQSGLLAFGYLPVSGKRIAQGASGGVVVDRESHRVVGVLSGIGNSETPLALAVPTQSLVEFVSKVQPFLASRIFPSAKDVPASPFIGDLYPMFVPKHIDSLQRRPEEPEEIALLRKNAQTAADAMRNFIAIGTFDWGWDDGDPVVVGDEYEMTAMNGEQRFRKYPHGTKELNELPLVHLKGETYLTDEWATLLKMVGTEYKLKIRQAPEMDVGGRRVKVFQYYASSEDKLCRFQPYDDYLFYIVKAKVTTPPCYGEVWTDEHMNVIRMSENYDLSAKLRDYKGWKTSQTVLTYGWLEKPERPRQLVPWTFIIQGRLGRHAYWNRGFFRDYQEFNVKSRLLAAH